MIRICLLVLIAQAGLSAAAFGFGLGKGTGVETPKGRVNIESLKVGDKVLSCAPDGACSVSTVVKRDIDEQEAIRIETKYGATVVGTDEKLFLAGKWVEAHEIEEGDFLQHQSGLKVEVLSVETLESATLYAIEIDPHHNFYANTVLVHNFFVLSPGEIVDTWKGVFSSVDRGKVDHYGRLCAKGAADNIVPALTGGVTTGVAASPLAGLFVFGASTGAGCLKRIQEDESDKLIDEMFDNYCAIQ